MRNSAYGENHKLNIIDRIGGYLSTRVLRQIVKNQTGCEVLDLGAGFYALNSRKLLSAFPKLKITAVDLQLDESLVDKMVIIKGELPSVLATITTDFDLIILNNVIEHLDFPSETVLQLVSKLKPNGKIFINVPNWQGKWVHEFLSFKLKIMDGIEINDHKNYYTKRQLWTLLANSKIKPNQIRIKTHKFFLNTLAIINSE